MTADHRTAVRRYVERIGELSGSEWPLVIEAFNLLRHAVVVRVDDRAYTFAQVYEELVDARYGTPFIKGLLDLEDVGRGSIPLWAAAARHIYRDLTEMGLHDPERYPESRLLMAYCLYWWQSFCKGYAFEVEIFRDLERSGLRFQAHDVLDPTARRSPHDLFISDFRGDVKTSVYFLLKASGERVSSDFFITRVWLPIRRARTLAVFLQDVTWETIDGETLLTLLSDLEEVLPRPARIPYHGGHLVVADYADWKGEDGRRKGEDG
ncbi:MAG: hypothetical protein ACE5IJ_07490 [Thermoplasmata archaeon]